MTCFEEDFLLLSIDKTCRLSGTCVCVFDPGRDELGLVSISEIISKFSCSHDLNFVFALHFLRPRAQKTFKFEKIQIEIVQRRAFNEISILVDL